LLVHTRKRGKQFHYVCRVPCDLQHLFPTVQLTRSLKTGNEKDAKIAASAIEYQTQQLFLQLRTGMLSKELENRLVASYLLRGANRIVAEVQGTEYEPPEVATPIDAMVDTSNVRSIKEREKWYRWAVREGDPSRLNRNESIAQALEDQVQLLRLKLADREAGYSPVDLDQTENMLRSHGAKITEKQKAALGLKLTDAQIQLNIAEIAALRGDWATMQALKASAERKLATPISDLKTVLEKYQDNYLTAKSNLKQGSKDDMVVECRVLLEIFGNISISDFNTMDSVTELKKVLRRYPKNKLQRFGNKSIHSLLKERQPFEVISPKTANNYLDRARQVVAFAGKSKLINAANVYTGERFQTEKAAEDERLAYDTEDIKQLINAICTQPLWTKNPPYPERFWLILIALFHGLRLGNIVALTKEDICQTDRGTWVFRLRTGKTKATVRSVAICDSLVLLRFLDWVEKLPRKRLFQDSTRSFSAWYNRNEVQKNGKPSLGFEARYVTTDKGKCLYSLRHSFAGNVFDVTEDFKITKDMMGHSTGNSVTARYTKGTKAESLKEITEKMQLNHIDLDSLEARSLELFDLPLDA
jgi:integrase